MIINTKTVRAGGQMSVILDEPGKNSWTRHPEMTS